MSLESPASPAPLPRLTASIRLLGLLVVLAFPLPSRAQVTPADTGLIDRERWNEWLAWRGDPERDALLLRGWHALGQSSFDRTGGNDDGFTGRHSFLYREANEWVIFDEVGPGFLTRIHFALFDTLQPGQHENYRIRFTFDGENEPRIDLPLKEFLRGRHDPFVTPFAWDDLTSIGAPLVSYPLAFRESLRITTTGPPNFFDLQGLRHREPRGIHTHDPRYDTREDTARRLEASGRILPPPPGSIVTTASGTAAPGAPLVIADLTGPGTVQDLVLELGRTPVHTFRLRVTFDGAPTPQIEAPLGFLLGNGLGNAPATAHVFGWNPSDGRGYFRLAMPFRAHARIELESVTAPAQVAARVAHVPTLPDGDFGELRASYREELQPTNGRDVAVFAATGRGKLAAVSMTIGVPSGVGTGFRRSFLEGDERIHLDGSLTPDIHGTGTEEFFDWGWYDSGVDAPFHLPLHGYPEHELGQGRSYTACYRVLLHDPVPWEKDIRFGLEHGGDNDEFAEYRMLVLYYAQDTVGLVRTDVLDVGRSASETTHAWDDPSGLLLPSIVEEYEGDDDDVPIRDEGRRSPGPHAFRMSIDPTNDGVRLRRRTDQGFSRQRATVSVDGERVGVWYLARTNANHRWYDDDFEIPERFTAGKNSITIEISPSTPTWNAYRYEVFCYRPVP